MTVSTTVSKKVYAGNGVTTAFATTFQFFANTDLVVSIVVDSTGVETVMSLTTHYTVTGGSGATGTVTMITAPATGETLVIKRSTPYTQSTDYAANDSFPADAHETALDRATVLAQQAYSEALSSPVLPATFEPGVSTRPTIPLPVANKVLMGNSGATGWTGVTLSDQVTIGGLPIAITAAAAGDILMYNGTMWVDATALTGAYTFSGSNTHSGNNSFSGSNTHSGNNSFSGFNVFTGELGGSAIADNLPGHRLSLTTALPVTVADVTAATIIYWTPWLHERATLWDGTYWRNVAVTQKSLTLDSDAGHTGYHQSGKNFDVFADYNAGTPRIVTGPAWTNDTARADAISRTNGIYVNDASIVVRFGTAAGDTATKTAGTLRYLGTFRASANGQTEDSFAKRFVWNMYNRRPRAMRVPGAGAWNYTTAAYRQANATATYQLDAVFGLAEDEIEVNVHVTSVNSSVSVTRYVGIGVDSTTANSAQFFTNEAEGQNAGNRTSDTAVYKGFAAVGRHYYAWLELSSAVGTATWYGDNSGIFGTVWA